MRGIIAQAVVDVPLSDTMKTLVGIIGLMVLVITVLTCVLLIKKVFGRTPPLDQEFKKLRSEIYEVSGRVKKEIGKDINELSARTNEVEGEIEEIKLDRERKWQALQGEIHALDIKLAKMMSNVEFIIRRMDRDDGQ
jgi:hypothetical protein